MQKDAITSVPQLIEEEGLWKSALPECSIQHAVDLRRGEYRVSSEPRILCALPDQRAGSVIQVDFVSGSAGSIQIRMRHQGAALANSGVVFKGLTPGQQARCVFKVPLILRDTAMEIASSGGQAVIKDLRVFHHQDQAISTTLGILDGKRHQGGASFAVLE